MLAFFVTFFVCFIVFTISDWNHINRGKRKVGEKIGAFIIPLLVSMVMGGVVFVIFLYFAPCHYAEEGTRTVQLASLQQGEGINGNFFLGSGSIGTDQYYFFYKKIGNSYQFDKVIIDDNVLITEEDRQDGELRISPKEINSPWRYFTWPLVRMSEETSRYEFVIPEGSIQQNFILK